MVGHNRRNGGFLKDFGIRVCEEVVIEERNWIFPWQKPKGRESF